MKRALLALAVAAVSLVAFSGSALAAVPSQQGGYWMLTEGGSVYAFGGAQDLGSIGIPIAGGLVHITNTRSGNGYWILGSTGGVFPYGDAVPYGSGPAVAAGERYTTMAATPSGKGYWLFTNKGRVFARGDAVFHGDMSSTVLNGPVLDAIATPSGNGYYMVGSDGGVFSFGDAAFHGSTGNMRLNKPVMSLAPDPDGAGYWLVASDGGVFAFSAPFHGSMGATPLNKPISGMVASPTGGGYLMVAQDGGIFSFGDVPFHGSLGASPPAAPVVSVAAIAERYGYPDGTFLVGTDIAPGTYRTTSATESCYWARLSGLGGTLEETIANDFSDGWQVVTIAPTDKAFKTENCGRWTDKLERVTAGDAFGEGKFIVGLDLQPGTYRTDGGDSCYWARLRGFGGTLDEILANGFAGGQQIVTVSPTDAGFESSSCPTWTRIG